jgi:hydrogenase nickel insertion protein HypA
MHEYGIVRDLLTQVDQQVLEHHGKRAVQVVLAVDGGHVDGGFLADAFDTFKRGTTAGEAELVIVEAPVDIWCPACGVRSNGTLSAPDCPHCGGPAIRMRPSDEIYLQSVEIEV